MSAKERCPCGSGRPYRGCCEPYHRGEREPPDAEALMRSRYTAFARKETGYLLRTLHPDHDDRARPEADVLRELGATASTLRFMGLEILDRSEPDEHGALRVLFVARVFDKGRDRSFVELSEFAHDGEGWRYLRGDTLPLGKVSGDPTKLTIATFRP